MNLSPICLFTYNRLEETKQTLQALQNNHLAKESDLYIFSDGWKNEKGMEKIKKVREHLRLYDGFKKVTIVESDKNKGLANSIISGVNKVLEKHDRAIVIEDDLITSPNFLDFMNQSLAFYETNEAIFSISGYTMDLPSLKKKERDFYLSYRASSWGWGTWRRSWVDIDWDMKDYTSFKASKKQRKEFNKGGGDMTGMLAKQMSGKIDSWAIRWCFNQFKRQQYTLYASSSKVQSIGFGSDATHTKGTKRFDTPLDQSDRRSFVFENEPKLDKMLVKEFRKKFSILTRAADKIGL